MISALASILQTTDEEKKTMDDIMAEMSKIKDTVGTFYRYFLAHSILKRKVDDHVEKDKH